jgi:hypothetical protein
LTLNPSSANLFLAMKKFSIISVLLLCISFPSIAHTFDGPLQIRNQFPLFINVNAPYLESASIENSLSASLSHSSVYLVKNSSEWSMGLDMEITELDLMFKKNINDFIELGVDLPVLSFNSGFMDGFLNSYHDAFGFPDYGRSNRPDNEFLYEVRRNGDIVIKGKGGRTGIGDMRLTVKKPLLKGDPAISIRGDLEFPTGNADAGYGNGSLDAGIAILVDKRLAEWLKTYMNIGVVFPGNLKGHEKVNLRDFIYGGTAIEASVWKDISLLGQLFIQGSPFPKTGISSVDRTAVLLSFGGRYSSGNNSFELSLTEDPNTSGAPDFTLNFSFKRKF